MNYKKCEYCGANNAPGERCDCKGIVTIVADSNKVHTAAYDEAYSHKRAEIFAALIQKRVPSCVADDIAKKEARKKAILIANATSDVFKAVIQGVTQ